MAAVTVDEEKVFKRRQEVNDRLNREWEAAGAKTRTRTSELGGHAMTRAFESMGVTTRQVEDAMRELARQMQDPWLMLARSVGLACDVRVMTHEDVTTMSTHVMMQCTHGRAVRTEIAEHVANHHPDSYAWTMKETMHRLLRSHPVDEHAGNCICSRCQRANHEARERLLNSPAPTIFGRPGE